MARSDMYRKLAWTGGDPRQVAEIVNNLIYAIRLKLCSRT